MTSAASRSVLFFRTYLTATMPLYAAIVAELCASPELPFELASTLEDIGQGFIGLSEQVNDALLRRGVLDQEVDADQTIEAKVERIMSDLALAAKPGASQARDRALAIFEDEAVRQAVRTALFMTHDLACRSPPG